MGYYIYQDEYEYWRWYLLAPPHRRIAESPERFVEKEDCRAAIALVQGSADVPIYETWPTP